MGKQGKNVDIFNRMQAYCVTENIDNTGISFSKKRVILQQCNHPLYPMIQPNFYIEELIQNTTSRARMDSSKLTMF